MCTTLADTIDALASQVATIAPDRLSAAEARELHDLLARAERLAVAGRTLGASAIDRTGAFREAGHRSAASYVAATTGTTMAAAASTISTARALPRLAATREAFISGTLSASQAAAVTVGAVADPESEHALLQLARTEAVSELRRKAWMIRAAAPGGENALEAIRASRYLRHWFDDDGGWRLEARLAPDDGAKVRALIEARSAALRAAGRRAGTPPSPEHAGADALVDLVTGRAEVKAVVNVHVDATAIERGRLEPGERSEISGVGPISVGAAKRLLSEGWLTVIERAGVDVRRVAHLGRYIPAHLRTALDAKYTKCAIASCTNTERLNYDHRIPVSEGGETALWNLWKLCEIRCHYLKTFHGWVPEQQADGTWELVPPARAP